MSINKMTQMQKKAAELMKNGESSLKTHLFKWDPNYLEAIPRFMDAAPLFENVGDFTSAIKCYEKLALCYEKTDDYHGAADALQKIGFLTLKHKKDPKTAHQYMMKSVNLYKIHGNTLKAQEMMKQLGKNCFDQGHEELGSQIYKSLIEDMLDDQNYGTGSEIIPQYLDFLIEKERYSDAIAIYNAHMKYLQSIKKYDHIVARCWLGIICIHIILGEHYIAEEKMGAFGASITKISSSDEYSAALNLIDAINKGDEMMYQKVLKRPIFGQMESALVKKLKKRPLAKKEDSKKVTNALFGSAGMRKDPVPDKPMPQKEIVKETVKEPIKEKPKEVPLLFGKPISELKAQKAAEENKNSPNSKSKEEEKKPIEQLKPTEEPYKSILPVEEKPVAPEKKLEELKISEEKKEVQKEEKKEEKKEEPKPEKKEEAAKKEEADKDFGGIFT